MKVKKNNKMRNINSNISVVTKYIKYKQMKRLDKSQRMADFLTKTIRLHKTSGKLYIHTWIDMKNIDDVYDFICISYMYKNIIIRIL